jgi:hypothetical protein|tara:strand:+ start:125 stop:427 length:303 start_codon:yes stop_codon:yes gene_type:complete
MKLTKQQLKQLIKEEIQSYLSEDDFDDYAASASAEVNCGKLEAEIGKARQGYASLEAYLGSGMITREDLDQQAEFIQKLYDGFRTKCKGKTIAKGVSVSA